MGAWIETTKGGSDVKFFWVAPFMGAWIETHVGYYYFGFWPCRTLHGCVD